MMRALIIEDEKPASQKLIRLLKKIHADIEVIDVLTSVEQSINWFLKNPGPELIFMDIQLDDGICFEIFENRNIQTPVIFTTAYDEYTLKAFKINSIDYLLKPIDSEELKKALKKFKTLHKPTNYHTLESIMKQLQSNTKERFLVKVGEHYQSIETSKINCFYIKERCNFIHADNGRNYPIEFSLDKIEQLVDPRLFFRINRNFIINITAIRDIIAYSSSRLKIILKGWSEKDDLIVSRERAGIFKEWMDR